VRVCHDFRRFPPFLCLSPKRPHLFTQPMTCFSFPFLHDLYHILSYLFTPPFYLIFYLLSVISNRRQTRSSCITQAQKPLAHGKTVQRTIYFGAMWMSPTRESTQALAVSFASATNLSSSSTSSTLTNHCSQSLPDSILSSKVPGPEATT